MTLPTRPEDGGIDWGILFQCVRLFGGEWFEKIGHEIAAHTRERCAKWHDEQYDSHARIANEHATAGNLEMASAHRSIAETHYKSAVAIRKMES